MQVWILPPGINFLLVILGCFFLRYSRIIGKTLIISGIVSLWLLSMPIIAYNLINFLQNKYAILTKNDIKTPKPHGIIIVLGGGDTIRAEYANKRTVSDFTAHRINYAVYLHQHTKLPILLSGGRHPRANKSEATLMQDFLWDNYKLTAKYIENNSLTTADESRFILPILNKNRLNEVYLVTNAWHMPRSVYIFQCRGIKVIPAPMGHYIYGPGYSWISFLPNMDALAVASIAMHEFIGLVWYYLHYHDQCIN